MNTSTLIVQAMASTTGQIITDSVPVLYYIIAVFLIGLTLSFFMRAFRAMIKNINR